MKHFEKTTRLIIEGDVVVRGYTTRAMDGRITAEITQVLLEMPRHQDEPWQTSTQIVDVLGALHQDELVRLREEMANAHWCEGMHGREGDTAIGEVG